MLAKSFAIAAGVAVTLASFDAGAIPVLPSPAQDSPYVAKIAGGCGPGWHRGPYGGCRRNWAPYPYGAYGRRCWFRPTPWGPRRVCRW